MIVEIPTVKRSYNDGKVVTQRGNLAVDIITSVFAHLKWEEEFQSTLKCDLATYTERLGRNLNKNPGKVEWVGALKVLYCYIDSPKIPTFKDFTKILDLEVADEILEIIKTVLEQTKKSVSKN